MDLRQLKYFIAVAEERSFSRAAARLHLTQPPLTRQIQGLESDLGVALFARTPRGVDLTQAGEALLDDARNLQSLAEKATERAQRAGRGQTGRLDVGLYGSAMFDVVPRLLAHFASTHPDVKIVLHHGQAPAQVTALRQGRVLVVFERMLPEEPDIDAELVAREPLLIAMHANHPLAGKKAIDIGWLRDVPMVMPVAPSSQLRNVALELCLAHGFEPRVSQQVSDVVVGAVLVASGTDCMLGPASLRNLHLPNLVCRPLKGGDAAFTELHCFYLKGERSPLLGALLDTVRKHRHPSGLR